jgi:site-specific DNA-methyltransferase (adenine-specific)
MLFIVPSRWFSGGKGLDSFRKTMLKRKDIRSIRHIDNASEIFSNSVDIKGGVNYFLKDSKYDGKCDFNGSQIDLGKYDVLVDSKWYKLIEKLSESGRLTDLYKGRCFGVESNDKRLTTTNKTGTIKCYVSKQKGFEKYIKESQIKKSYNYWKVITAEASDAHGSGFGNIFVGTKDEVHTGSYISFKVKSKTEAKSLVSYMRCKLSNLMLSLRKNSQHINENVLAWIPLVPLDRIWTDATVYKYFKLSSSEIKLINKAEIKGYKPIKKLNKQIDISSSDEEDTVQIEKVKSKKDDSDSDDYKAKSRAGKMTSGKAKRSSTRKTSKWSD